MKFIKEQRDILVNDVAIPKAKWSKTKSIGIASIIAIGISSGSGEQSRPIPSPVSTPSPIIREHKSPPKLRLRTKLHHHSKIEVVQPSPIPLPSIQKELTLELKYDKVDLDNKLISKNVSNGEVKFENDKIRIRGKYHVIGPFNIPFNMLAHFVRNPNAIGLQIDQLSIAGENASREKYQQAQSKINEIIKLKSDVKHVNLIVMEKEKKVFEGKF